MTTRQKQTLFDPRSPTGRRLRPPKSALPLEAMTGRWQTKRARRATRWWLDHAVLSRTASLNWASLVALLAARWWAAPRARDPGRRYLRYSCGACGAFSDHLELHLIFGQAQNIQREDGSPELACSCIRADLCRVDWEGRVAARFDEHARPAAVAALQQAPPRSYRRLAIMLGHAAGVDMPWPLARGLPRAFAFTWGAWSARELRTRGR